MSSLSTLPKGDSAWLLRKAVERIMQQVSVLETNIGSSTTGNSANTQVIFNDAGTLRGDAGLTYNAATDTLSAGSATITGDLTVDTNVLKVDSLNNRVGIGTATPACKLEVVAPAGDNIVSTFRSGDATAANNAGGGFQSISSATAASRVARVWLDADGADLSGGDYFFIQKNGNSGTVEFNQSSNAAMTFLTNGTERYRIASDGVATWSNVGGVAGTAMTLNATGLGVGDAPAANTRLTLGSVNPTGLNIAFKTTGVTTGRVQTSLSNTSGDLLSGIEGSTAGQTLTGSAAYSAFIGTFTNNPFYLVSNGLIRATLDTSGNVGIGVTPSAWVSSSKAIDMAGWAAFGYIASSAATVISNNTYKDSASNWVFKNGSNAAGYFEIAQNLYRWWQAPAAGGAGTSGTFTQAMTLDASGYLLIGTTDTGFTSGAGYKFGPGATPSNGQVGASSSNGDLTLRVYSTGAAAYRFYVGYGGTVFATNTTISAISDARFKENVQDIDVGLGAILALKPRKFDWKAGKGKDIKGDRGFIAQEFEQVFPQLVDEWADPAPEGEAPYKSVRQDLIPVLVKAIQELAAEVNALKNA